MHAANLLPVGRVSAPGMFAGARRRVEKNNNKKKNQLDLILVAKRENWSNCNCKSGVLLAPVVAAAADSNDTDHF